MVGCMGTHGMPLAACPARANSPAVTTRAVRSHWRLARQCDPTDHPRTHALFARHAQGTPDLPVRTSDITRTPIRSMLTPLLAISAAALSAPPPLDYSSMTDLPRGPTAAEQAWEAILPRIADRGPGTAPTGPVVCPGEYAPCE